MNNNKKNAGNHKHLSQLVNQSITPKVYKSLKAVRRIIYPPSCLLCDAPGFNDLNLCSACHSDLPWNKHACRRCALPLNSAAALCGQCLSQPPTFDDTVAPLRYAPSTAWLITGLKFRQQLGNAQLLGHFLTELLLQQDIDKPTLIMPVPLHSQRLRERGYNQAIEIARPISRALNLDLDNHSLIRSKPTAPQSSLALKARRNNLRGAFVCKQNVTDKHIALVDDVMTSGSTLNAAALALKKAGARRVSVWVAARAPLPAI